MEISTGMCSFHFHGFFPEDKAIQAKRPRTSKNWQMERTFSIWKFRLGILVNLSRNPVSPRKFPFGEAQFIYIPSEISGFLGVTGKQSVFTLSKAHWTVCVICDWPEFITMIWFYDTPIENCSTERRFLQKTRR